MARMVQCMKLGRELPGLDAPPIPGALGQRIYEHISAEAWRMWQAQSLVLINHHGLVLADPEARAYLREQMEQYLFEEEEDMPEGWAPEEASKGGAPAKGGAPSKGAAPRK